MTIRTGDIVRGMLRFSWLDSSRDMLPVYSIGWRILDNPDVWSQRFLGFKAKNRSDVRGAALVTREALQRVLVQENIDRHGLAISTALSSSSTGPQSGSPLYILGKWLAEQLDVKWEPAMFSKVPHRSLHNLVGGADRDAEVENKYTCQRRQDVSHLLLLDDFVTRGATLGEMTRAATAANPGIEVVGFALGKSERASYAAQFGIVIDNSHVPVDWDRLWLQGEN